MDKRIDMALLSELKDVANKFGEEEGFVCAYMREDLPGVIMTGDMGLQIYLASLIIDSIDINLGVPGLAEKIIKKFNKERNKQRRKGLVDTEIYQIDKD